MIRRLLKLSVYAVLVSSSDRSDLDLPDSARKILEDLCPLLEPFEQATELLSKEDTPTISQILIIVQRCLQTVQAESADQSTAIRSFKEKVSSGLISQFRLDPTGSPNEDKFSAPVVLATFLDPRYKTIKNFSASIKERLVGYVSDLLANGEGIVSVKEEVKEDERKESIFDCLTGDVQVDLTADDTDDEIRN